MKSDDEIRKNVIDELNADPQLQKIASQIGVSVKDEVVTLTGTVEFYSQKNAAEMAAERVAAVKVLAVDIEVKGTSAEGVKTDPEIAAAIRNALTWHSAVNENLIDIKVDAGWVYLSGNVNWDYERKAAEKAIENIIGVKGVINQIRINPREVQPDDIKRKIKAAFHRSATLDAENISAMVNGNVVTLTGKVRSWAERKDAEQVVWAMPGVTEVRNDLEIMPAVMAD